MTVNPGDHKAPPARRCAHLLTAILVGAIACAGCSSTLWAQPPTDCKFGQRVTYQPNRYGLIVSGRDEMCLVRSVDGAAYDWVPLAQLSVAVDPPLPAAPPNATAGAPPAASPGGGGTVTVVRPTTSRGMVYRADRSGHVRLTADVNGAPVRFVVDTGATLVALTLKDASAAGIRETDLTYNRTIQTANGVARGAVVRLREIRLDRLVVDDVPAVVQQEGLHESLLGMSFLRRLKSFEMRDGELTISP